ncbi:hypothetical protein LEP1GSC005_2593 [Leptospira santarosai str. ST188]|nr:hypothetical protein LEP1GSC068_2226 [Leptospira sp. Fiocruz LV3954]EMF89568.1 hypothetical protein LEP1GSC005_2593 [Leptospira santarosai str. ST188]EMI64378.1 hypothetical protein LEP1GSC076_2971 [Leptospira sp. Fiocruz LV4135]EMM85095.1 hypothetical protein LEP1GSC039_0174 [Leptospira santarosai str. 2000027870]EMO33053.1 hypothetical protein LEP1GSC175_1454 [Leptospira santarosai str. HAI821]
MRKTGSPGIFLLTSDALETLSLSKISENPERQIPTQTTGRNRSAKNTQNFRRNDVTLSTS